MSSSLNVSEPFGPIAAERCKAVAKRGGSVGVLFVGEEGAGQQELANRLAASLLCLSASNGEPCGDCAPCRTMSTVGAVDMLTVTPVSKSDVIRVGQVVPSPNDENLTKPPIRDFLRTGPIQSPCKVVLIQRADRLNTDASNALLKMLEEPPSYGRFLLTTSAESAIAPTIRSRCVILRCDMTPTERETFLDKMTGGAPSFKARLQDAELEPFVTAFEDWYSRMVDARKAEALRISDEFQSLCNLYKVDDDDETGLRFRRAEVVRFLANLAASEQDAKRLASLIEMHGAILGNVNFSYLCDSHFCETL